MLKRSAPTEGSKPKRQKTDNNPPTALVEGKTQKKVYTYSTALAEGKRQKTDNNPPTALAEGKTQHDNYHYDGVGSEGRSYHTYEQMCDIIHNIIMNKMIELPPDFAMWSFFRQFDYLAGDIEEDIEEGI